MRSDCYTGGAYIDWTMWRPSHYTTLVRYWYSCII